MGGGRLTLLLDTHVLLWWLRDEPGLTPQQVQALDRAEAAGDALALSAISLWEIAKLADAARIQLTHSLDGFLEALEHHSRLRVLPLSARVALESTRLAPRFHRDPADQIIAATARVHGLRLVTADGRIRASGVVSVV